MSSLKSGGTKSCGCLIKEPRPHKRKENHLAAKNAIYRSYKKGAKERQYLFDLTFNDVVNLIEQDCYYCGSQPNAPSHLKAHTDYYTNGIDRLDNKQGYIKINCVPCCNICNMAKRHLDIETWKKWIKKVYEKQFTE